MKLDALNRFETRKTFLLSRLEWLVGLGVAIVLAIIHFGKIEWPVFIGLFVVIDLIGYIPGAIAFRRSATGDIPKGFYVAYNVMHSLVTGSVVAGLWAWLVKPEWALLALPIHLLGDRGIFGNSLKPFGVRFEPERHRLFAAFEREYESAGRISPVTVRSSADAVSHSRA